MPDLGNAVIVALVEEFPYTILYARGKMTEKIGLYTSTIPGLPRIYIQYDGESIHYPASLDDVWAILRQLPVEQVRDIPVIDYRLDSDGSAQPGDEHVLDFPPSCRDPYTGRVGMELLPGVYAAYIGGCIHLTHRIVLTAYVYDPALPDRAMWECYLRFRMLSVLMHEVGHHLDTLPMRKPSPRKQDALEQTAETAAATWTTTLVIPYLRRQYADDVQRLETWASEWAGSPIRLDNLVDKPRALPEDPSWAAPWRLIPPWTVIPHLAHAVARGKSRREVQEWYEGYREIQNLR